MAAVLITLVSTGSKGLCFLMEVRSMKVSQPGEICFPGGRIEAGETPVITALREIGEELGVPAGEVEIMGELEPEMTSRGWNVYPVMGRIDESVLADIRLSEDEVSEWFLLPVKWIADNEPASIDLDTAKTEEIPEQLLRYLANYENNGSNSRRIGSIDYWVYEKYFIWGLTARILKRMRAEGLPVA